MYNSLFLQNYNNGDKMYNDLNENIEYLKNLTDKSADFTVRNMVLRDGTAVAIITIDISVNKKSIQCIKSGLQ